jgi:hypothetical protein
LRAETKTTILAAFDLEPDWGASNYPTTTI